ncbi:MAG: lysophospholipase [Acidobacteriota bacterium]|nr:lysophospholipase [Acidobacteriota bacterium]
MKKSIWGKLFASFLRLVFPAIMLVVFALVAVAVLLVHRAAEPPRTAYLVTPESLSSFTQSKVKISEETWQNKDSTAAGGWLLRGGENAPAVVLLHRYGADRSWLLNLGVKLNEATGFTVLIPDQRGHGANPSVKWSGFGGIEGEDLAAAVQFLRNQKTSDRIGVYGVEMGALAAVFGAGQESAIRALALDSVPASSEDVLGNIVKARTSMAGEFARGIANHGTKLYYPKAFRRDLMCDTAPQLENRKILLLAGKDAPALQESTVRLGGCLPKQANAQLKTGLPISGFNLINSATSQQQEDYDQMVINFFRSALSS